MVQRGEADVGVGAISMFEDRLPYVDFLPPLYRESMVYAVGPHLVDETTIEDNSLLDLTIYNPYTIIATRLKLTFDNDATNNVNF